MLWHLQALFDSDLKIETKHYFKRGQYYIPHPDKQQLGGEDAIYNNQVYLAVADGSQAYTPEGHHPGEFSRELLKHLGDFLRTSYEDYQQNPARLLKDSIKLTRKIGSGTVCVLTIDPQESKLLSSYIGDAGYILYRKTGQKLNKISRSDEHIHVSQIKISSTGNQDYGIISNVDNVQHGDFVVLATDGLFDNLDEDQIAKIIENYLEKQKLEKQDQFDEVAKIIAMEAYKYSEDKNYLSPFAKRMRRFDNTREYIGGKLDDITVIFGEVIIEDSLEFKKEL